MATGCCTLTVQGALQWTSRTVALQAQLDERSVRAVYVFRNVDDRPVRILAVKTSCGCTTTIRPKESYAAGESGAIKVDFEIGGFTGRQEKQIWVTTDADPERTEELRLIVDIPQLLTVVPRIVWWSIGNECADKTVTITVHPDAKAGTPEIRSGDANMSHRLERISPCVYRLHVRPQSTERAIRTALVVQITPERLPLRTVMIFAQVR